MVVLRRLSFRRASWALRAAAVFLPSLAAAATAGDGPSFSCAGVKGMAAVVCGSPALSLQDRRMDALYRVARVSVTGEAPSGEVAIQRQWLRDTEKICTAAKSPEPCISTRYGDRNDELAVAALFGAHDVALNELTSPPEGLIPAFLPAAARTGLAADRRSAAALYEAIYRYASIDPLPARVAAVVPLIAPLFETIKGEPWDGPTSGQQKPEDAVASDQSFAAFLAVASVSIGSEHITLPCGALVRRPGLIGILKAYYGGAIDGHLLVTSCATATTPLPAFDLLIATANKAQADCPGTIRFSLWRDTERTLTAVRLHRMDVLFPNNSPGLGHKHAVVPVGASPEVEEFLSTHSPTVGAAQREMASYYVAAFHVPREAAQANADIAIRSAVQAVYGGCERG